MPECRRKIVIVLGMHRSGTSLCSNILHDMGVDMAEYAGASPANAHGHWERNRINDLHDEILALFGRAWDSPTHHLAMPQDWWLDPRVTPTRTRIVEYLRTLLQQPGPIGFKDPRTSRLLALWPGILDELALDPVYIFCIRDPAQVVRSITARDRLAGDQAAHRWLVYNAEAVHGAGAATVCIIGYEDWFTAPQQSLDRLAHFIGLEPQAQFLSIIDQNLRHDALGAAEAIPAIATRLHQQISATDTRLSPALRDLCETILGCNQAVLPFLIDAALLPLSINEQNRVIGDLNALIEKLRSPQKAL